MPTKPQHTFYSWIQLYYNVFAQIQDLVYKYVDVLMFDYW